ncbi:potassium channel family protein [Arthrobacter flavus]
MIPGRRNSKSPPAAFLELDQRRRRRVLFGAVLRSTVTLAAILVVYFLVPVSGFAPGAAGAAWIRLIALLLIFLVAVAFQIQLVLTSGVPQVRAAEAVAQSVALFLCLFALLYASISATDPQSFSEPLNRVDALYLTTATFATVGFGDVVPISTLARVAVTIQMITGLGLLVLIVKVVFFAARQGLLRRG